MKGDPHISADLLLHGYAAGVFPMAEGRDDPDLFWVDPKHRGILPLDALHVSRSLGRTVRRAGYSVTLNRSFAAVLRGCAARDETWISATISTLYTQLHARGHAHSLEVWEDGDVLAGGVYGVTLGAAFFGESMFSARRDGSKRALVHLVDHLARTGFQLFDTQFITPHLATLGAVEIPRATYHRRLARALERRADITSVPLDGCHVSVLQRITQTS